MKRGEISYIGQGVGYSSLRAGDKLQADAGFTCVKPGEVLEIKERNGGLYVECEDGDHFLDGQLDFDDQETLVGLTIVPEFTFKHTHSHTMLGAQREEVTLENTFIDRKLTFQFNNFEEVDAFKRGVIAAGILLNLPKDLI